MARFFAVVPAAGHSLRMGQAKLLLPLSGRPLIWHTIEAWRRSGVDRVVVVVRPGDEALARAVGEFQVSGSKFQVGVDLVVPEVAPVDMKASVRAALVHVENRYSPSAGDAFLLAPADMPRLSWRIAGRLLEQHGKGGRAIIAPSLNGKRGHPVLFSWRLAEEVFGLADDEGLDAIVRRHEPLLVECEDLVAADEQPFGDVDTMEEYERVMKDEG